MLSFPLFDRLNYFADLINRADSGGCCLTDGEKSSRGVHIEAGDSFGAFDAGYEALGAVCGRVEHDVVPAGVDQGGIIDEEDRVLDVRLHTTHEARVTGDGAASAQTWLGKLRLHEE